MSKVKEYFSRLKSHPGVPAAFYISMIYISVGSNDERLGPVDGILTYLGFSLIFWAIVLYTNIKR